MAVECREVLREDENSAFRNTNFIRHFWLRTRTRTPDSDPDPEPDLGKATSQFSYNIFFKKKMVRKEVLSILARMPLDIRGYILDMGPNHRSRMVMVLQSIRLSRCKQCETFIKVPHGTRTNYKHPILCNVCSIVTDYNKRYWPNQRSPLTGRLCVSHEGADADKCLIATPPVQCTVLPPSTRP